MNQTPRAHAALSSWRSAIRAGAAQPKTTRPARVIVLGGDPRQRRSLVTVLLNDGYDVHEAPYEADLIDMVVVTRLDPEPAHGVDLVVADLRIRLGARLDALAVLRRSDWRIPFIVITNHCDAVGRAEARRLNAVAVFSEPFDLDDLRTAALNTVEPPRGHERSLTDPGTGSSPRR